MIMNLGDYSGFCYVSSQYFQTVPLSVLLAIRALLQSRLCSCEVTNGRNSIIIKILVATLSILL